MCTSVLYYNNINKDHQKLAIFNNKYKSKQQNSRLFPSQNPTHFSQYKDLVTYQKACKVIVLQLGMFRSWLQPIT